MLLLFGKALVETRLAVMHRRGDLGLALLDLGVVGALGLSAGLHRNRIGFKLGLDGGRALGGSLGKDSHFTALLNSKGEPLVDFSGQLLLAGEGVGDVEEGARRGDDDTVLAQSLDAFLDQLKGLLEVVLPDITSVDNAHGEDLLGAELLDHRLQLLRVADQVDMQGVDVGKSRENIEVVDNVAEVGGNGELRASSAERSNGLVGRLEGVLDGGPQVEYEDGLIDLDPLVQ